MTPPLFEVRFHDANSDNNLWFASTGDTSTDQGWERLVMDAYAALEQLVLRDEHLELTYLMGRLFTFAGVPLGRIVRTELKFRYPELSADNQQNLLSAQLERLQDLKSKSLDFAGNCLPLGFDQKAVVTNPSNPTAVAALELIGSQSRTEFPSHVSRPSLGAWLKCYLDHLERQAPAANTKSEAQHVGP